jgi:hypothetical protein
MLKRVDYFESLSVQATADYSKMTRDQLLKAKEEVLTALYDLDHPPRR